MNSFRIVLDIEFTDELTDAFYKVLSAMNAVGNLPKQQQDNLLNEFALPLDVRIYIDHLRTASY